MERYDVKCPICGTLNRDLYLEETDGWMECEHCGTATQSIRHVKMKKVPLYTGEQLARLYARSPEQVAV